MLNRSAFMKAVWSHYRRVAGPLSPFDRKLFADVLRFMWKPERARLQAERERQARAAEIVTCSGREQLAAPTRPLTEMERRIDGLKYLSARYPVGRMEREIRAEYAHA